jgi:MscS family membrane protein
MMNWNSLFQQFSSLARKVSVGNELWQLIASAAILVVGFVLLEILWRSANRRLQAQLEKRGVTRDIVDILAFLPPLRLGSAAFLLRTSEALLVMPNELRQLLHGIEAVFLSLAVIVLLFQLVQLMDGLRLALPERVQDTISEKVLRKLKGFLRITVLIGVVTVVIYTQKGFFPEWLWKYAWWRYLLVLAVVIMVYIGTRLVSQFLSSMTVALRDVEEKARLRLVLQAALWPIRLLMATIIVYAASAILVLPPTASRVAQTITGTLGTLAVIVFVYRLLDILQYELTKIAEREDSLLDKTFVQMIRMSARILVLTVGAIYLVRALSGKPMSTLLAGLGIGGLAIALASQDTLKNFFGSLMIMMDKPFKIGDRVVTGGYDGAVEEIGFRSTRVRTLTGHLVTIPNEKMAGNSVENIGRRPSIRRLTNITITYDTPPEKVERALAIVREILENHEGMDPDFPPRVFFNEFNDASLNILMIYWYFPPDYWGYLAFSERVNLQIMQAFEAEGIEFAFPTTTTYLAQDDRRPLHITLAGDSGLQMAEGQAPESDVAGARGKA